jgi:hypothetical protein
LLDSAHLQHKWCQRAKAWFPVDFAMHLNHSEFEALMSQFATSNSGRGGRRKMPMDFTDRGALMTASLVNSRRAVETSVYVVRAFVRLRAFDARLIGIDPDYKRQVA